MALIGTIRKNSWILVVMVGLGLFGFIIMDMFSGDKSLFGSKQFIIGEVAGEEIDYNEFSRVENILYGNSGEDVFARRDYLWDYFIEEKIVNKEADKLGIGVSKDELIDLQFGNNPSQIIQQRFMNPNTNQLDRQQLNQIKQAIETNQLNPQLRNFWSVQEGQILKERKQEKLAFLVNKAIYSPSWMVELASDEQNEKFNFSYVSVPFDEIEDGQIELTDEDFKAYYQKNNSAYRTVEENRKLAYVTFDVLPTKEDSVQLQTTISDLIPAFKEADNDSLFIENNYGIYNGTYFKKDQLNEALIDIAFEIPVGDIHGPYIDQNAYRAVKILDRKIIPDSVRSRHILIRATNQNEYINAKRKIDSLNALIIAGSHQFDSLAITNSQDPGSGAKGGDLGYAFINQMVQPFNDVIFYRGEPGKTYVVLTNFGVHLIEITDRKFITNEEGVKLGFLDQPIIPSEATQNRIYEEASNFMSKNRTMDKLQNAVAEREDLEINYTGNLKRNDYQVFEVGSGQIARDMIRWSFNSNTEINDVSPEVYIKENPENYFNSQYYLVGLTKILPVGKLSLEDIKEDITPTVRNLKKGEVISAAISGMSLSDIAAKYEIEVDTLDEVSFGAPYVKGMGDEPSVIGKISKIQTGDTSSPIIGKNGVYVATMNSKIPPDGETNFALFRKQSSLSTMSEVRNQLVESIRKNISVSDNRFQYY